MNEESNIDLAKSFENLFQVSSFSGEEELLRIASQYTLQLSVEQIRALLLLKIYSKITDDEKIKIALKTFIDEYINFKKYNQSSRFITKIFEYISLRKFLGENWLKVNIQK